MSASEERMSGKIERSVSASEERMSGKMDTLEERMKEHTTEAVNSLEKRTDDKFEQLTLQIGQGFNEVHEKLQTLDDIIENVRSIVGAEVKRVDEHESTITKIRKQLRSV